MIKSAIEQKTVGSLLKEKRKQKNLTLQEVSNSTKINPVFLKSLEEGKYNDLPSEVYVKGFLKNYAKFLEINSDNALALYRREVEISNNKSTIGTTNKILEQKLGLEITPNRIMAIFIVAAILFVILYIGSYVSQIFKSPELSLSQPVAISSNEKQTFLTKDPIIDIAGNIEPGSKLTINGQRFETNNFESFSTQLAVSEGTNTFVFVAENQFGRTTNVELIVIRETSPTQSTEQEDNTDIDREIDQIDSINEINIGIEIVNREAYLEIKIDGNSRLSKTLTVGELLNYKANTSFEISSPRPDAIKLFVNGQLKPLTTSRTYKWQIIDGNLLEN
jgi:cytoskeletal protein RodZ